MKSIAEVIIGKSTPEWSGSNVWMLRVFTSITGMAIWSVVAVAIELLQPGTYWNPMVLFSITGAYGVFLLGFAFLFRR